VLHRGGWLDPFAFLSVIRLAAALWSGLVAAIDKFPCYYPAYAQNFISV